MRRKLAIALVIALVLLALVTEFLTAGPAAMFQSLFYVALLGFVVGLLRLLIPPG